MAEFTFVERKPMDGAEHRLEADATVGREGCDVVLPDPEVSRRHAALRKTASGAAVEDLGSTNGTFVNGARISGLVPISEGDLVRFGNTQWQLRMTAPPGGGAPPGAAARLGHPGGARGKPPPRGGGGPGGARPGAGPPRPPGGGGEGRPPPRGRPPPGQPPPQHPPPLRPPPSPPLRRRRRPRPPLR